TYILPNLQKDEGEHHISCVVQLFFKDLLIIRGLHTIVRKLG
ncbi:hypothetical protein HKBW3S43_01546, partial [Candidatus Hakubella thermalkaliphila]